MDYTRRNTDQSPIQEDARFRALVADDDEPFLTSLERLLTRLGISCDVACDGRDAMNKLLMAGSYDLLLLDYEMPHLSGFDVISRVRANPRLCDVYAILLSSPGEVQMRVEAFDRGFDDYIDHSAGEAEIAAKLNSCRRIILRNRSLNLANRELYDLANRDELTGVFNRRYFFDQAERALLKKDLEVNVVLFDLDDFKHVNDTYGHLSGDRVLADIGSMFRRSTRYEDVIARYGGDEFAMLITNLAHRDAVKVATRLAGNVERLQWIFGTDTVSLSASTGIASNAFLPGATVPQLLAACDQELYKNKFLRKHPHQQSAAEPEKKEEEKIDDGEVRKTG